MELVVKLEVLSQPRHKQVGRIITSVILDVGKLKQKSKVIKDGAYYCLCAHYLRITQSIDHAIQSPFREYSIFVTLLVTYCFKSWVCRPL